MKFECFGFTQSLHQNNAINIYIQNTVKIIHRKANQIKFSYVMFLLFLNRHVHRGVIFLQGRLFLQSH